MILPPCVQDIVQLYLVHFVPEFTYKQGTDCTGHGYLIQRPQGTHIPTNRASETLALISRQRKSHSGRQRRKPSEGHEWAVGAQLSAYVSQMEVAPLGSELWHPNAWLSFGTTGHHSLAWKRCCNGLHSSYQTASRMICSFVYKEKCQSPEKIPRTMTVTHDRTEHVKLFLAPWPRVLM